MFDSSASLLDRLNFDVLKIICDAIENTSGESEVVKILDGFSRTCRLMREVALPTLFPTICVRGDWEQAMGKMEEMRGCAAIVQCVRLVFKFHCTDCIYVERAVFVK